MKMGRLKWLPKMKLIISNKNKEEKNLLFIIFNNDLFMMFTYFKII